MNFRLLFVLFFFTLVFTSCQKDSDSNEDQLIDPTASVDSGMDNVRTINKLERHAKRICRKNPVMAMIS